MGVSLTCAYLSEIGNSLLSSTAAPEAATGTTWQDGQPLLSAVHRVFDDEKTTKITG